MKTFKYNIKKLRKNKNLSQAQLAEELGIGQTAVSGWEQGRNEPDYEMLELLADFFGKDINYLLGYPTDKEIAFKQGLQDLQLERYKHLSEDDKELLADQFNALIDRLEKK